MRLISWRMARRKTPARRRVGRSTLATAGNAAARSEMRSDTRTEREGFGNGELTEGGSALSALGSRVVMNSGSLRGRAMRAAPVIGLRGREARLVLG